MISVRKVFPYLVLLGACCWPLKAWRRLKLIPVLIWFLFSSCGFFDIPITGDLPFLCSSLTQATVFSSPLYTPSPLPGTWRYLWFVSLLLSVHLCRQSSWLRLCLFHLWLLESSHFSFAPTSPWARGPHSLASPPWLACQQLASTTLALETSQVEVRHNLMCSTAAGDTAHALGCSGWRLFTDFNRRVWHPNSTSKERIGIVMHNVFSTSTLSFLGFSNLLYKLQVGG